MIYSSSTNEHFNSHPHEEDDIGQYSQLSFINISTHILTKRMTTSTPARSKFFRFQLTSSRRGWPMNCLSIPFNRLFQLTSSRRGWRYVCFILTDFYCTFQLTSSRRGWPAPSFTANCEYLFQLTSSRRGWLLLSELPVLCKYISTHILTKRMTVSVKKLITSSTFQLTSSRRGWQILLEYFFELIQYFNSHPHEEDDLSSFIKFFCSKYFNSHPHEEDDLWYF